MKKIFVIFALAAIIAVFLAYSGAVSAQLNAEANDFFGGRDEVSVIVVLKDSYNSSGKAMIQSQQENVFSGLKLKNKKSHNRLNSESLDGSYDFELKMAYTNVNGLSGKLTKSGYLKLKNNPNVLMIYEPKNVSVLLRDSAGIINATRTWGLVYNASNITGKGQSVCVIDTGVDYTRPALGNCSSATFTNGTCPKVIGGYDFVNSDNDSFDDHGHGTHVAGIVASNDSTSPGVAPGATIIAMKALDSSGSGSTSNIISAIDWCTSNSNSSKFNISVISMSLGVSGYSSSSTCDSEDTLMAASIHSAIGKNISVVAAAGNDGVTNGVSFPACISNVTVAGSVSKSDAVSSFSDRWSLPILFAPGGSINSTVPTGSCPLCSSSGFSSLSGTSMATPHISGAIALLRQYKKLEQNIALTPLQAQNALNSTGKQINDSGSGLTFSRINVYLALLSLDTIAPNITFVAPTPANNSNITVNSTSQVFINLTSGEVISSAILELSNSTKINNSMALAGLNAYINLSALRAGVNTYRVYLNDSAGNIKITDVYTLQINNTAPNISAFSPAQNINIAEPNNQAFSINFSDTENDNINFSWYLNSSLYLAGINKTEFNFTGNFTSAGVYSINVTLYDGSLLSYLSWNLTVNNTNRPVNITSFFPAQTNLSINKTTNQTFNITYSDLDSDDTVNISWFQNLTLESNSASFTFLGNLSAVGVYNITAIVSDGINSTSQSWNLIILNNAPNITFVNLTNTDFLNRTNGTLQASWVSTDNDSDAITANQTLWYINGTLNSNYTNATSINASNTTRYENWTFSIRVFDGFEWSSWANSSTIKILNAAPIGGTIPNITANETDLVNLNSTGQVNATDVDGDNLAFTYSAPFNSSGQWLTNSKDSRNYTINITVNDGNGFSLSQNIIVTILDKSIGGNDTIIGNLSDIITTISSLNLMINNATFNSSVNFTGTSKINFTQDNNTLIEFDYNLSNITKLNFVGVRINQTMSGGAQSLVISGIDLTSQGRTKTIYMNRTNETYNSVCIKDAEINSISQMNSDCSASDETKLSCDGTSTGGFTCTLQDTTYKITGLNHSGIKQISYTPSSGNSGGSSGGGGGGGGGSGGGGGGGGGGAAGNVCNMEWQCGDWTGCTNGKQARQCSFAKVPQHVQESPCADSSKSPESERNCEIKKEIAAEKTQAPAEKNEPANQAQVQNAAPEQNAAQKSVFGSVIGHATKSIRANSGLIASFTIAILIAGFAFHIHRKKNT